jgi:hypothetical protein
LFPSSPVDAKNETPAAAPEVKTFSKYVCFVDPSEPPQLMDTMSAREAAVFTAGKRSADEEVLAQTCVCRESYDRVVSKCGEMFRG